VSLINCRIIAQRRLDDLAARSFLTGPLSTWQAAVSISRFEMMQAHAPQYSAGGNVILVHHTVMI